MPRRLAPFLALLLVCACASATVAEKTSSTTGVKVYHDIAYELHTTSSATTCLTHTKALASSDRVETKAKTTPRVLALISTQ